MTAAETPRPLLLIVDDDPGVRAVVGMALRRAGFATVEAATGTEGLAQLNGQPIDLLLLDMGLPDRSGLEVIQAVRTRHGSETLPIVVMTGSSDQETVVNALDAGADDFLAKPAHFDELTARVRAHLRAQNAWAQLIEQGLRERVGIIAGLGRLDRTGDPQAVIEAITEELATRTASDLVAVLQVADQARLIALATCRAGSGLIGGSRVVPADRGREIIQRVTSGPWVETLTAERTAQARDAWTSGLDVLAGAPIYHRERLVGTLIIGSAVPQREVAKSRESALLAAVIDYATVVGALAGRIIAARQDAGQVVRRLRAGLSSTAFAPVFQPVVDLRSRSVVAYEALTRFSDGVRPDIRFAEAAAHGLGLDYETNTLEAALRAAARLPPGLALHLNVSPDLLRARVLLRRILDPAPDRGRRGRPVVLELTEHAAIEDYEEIRSAVAWLGRGIELAVDDAGAGYASLRHILELRPRHAKLDISIVRGLDSDALRQALVAGLVYFAARTGCILIAEGIETETEAEALTTIGVTLGQGFLFGLPAPLA